VLDTSLTLLDSIDYEVVERSASGSDGDIILVVNDTKVSQTSLTSAAILEMTAVLTWKPLIRP